VSNNWIYIGKAWEGQDGKLSGTLDDAALAEAAQHGDRNQYGLKFNLFPNKKRDGKKDADYNVAVPRATFSEEPSGY